MGKKGSPYDSTKTELALSPGCAFEKPDLAPHLQHQGKHLPVLSEMLNRKLILIDTSHALLADESATFGRFMIAQALQACYRRVKEKKPLLVRSSSLSMRPMNILMKSLR